MLVWELIETHGLHVLYEIDWGSIFQNIAPTYKGVWEFHDKNEAQKDSDFFKFIGAIKNTVFFLKKSGLGVYEDMMNEIADQIDPPLQKKQQQ